MKPKMERVLPDTQFGFRKGRQTEDVVMSLQSIVELSKQTTQSFDFIFLDFKKAFDSIEHSFLFSEMKNITKDIINHPIVSILRDYLVRVFKPTKKTLHLRVVLNINNKAIKEGVRKRQPQNDLCNTLKCKIEDGMIHKQYVRSLFDPYLTPKQSYLRYRCRETPLAKTATKIKRSPMYFVTVNI
uniref:Reverse transcriptase domain-containing protein n=1 Tax=Lepeophtheirus salmonis TaxID=72036 RepID=A0A0K2TXU8_LEPSM